LVLLSSFFISFAFFSSFFGSLVLLSSFFISLAFFSSFFGSLVLLSSFFNSFVFCSSLFISFVLSSFFGSFALLLPFFPSDLSFPSLIDLEPDFFGDTLVDSFLDLFSSFLALFSCSSLGAFLAVTLPFPVFSSVFSLLRFFF